MEGVWERRELQQYYKYKFNAENMDAPCNSTFHILVELDMNGSTMHDHFQPDPAGCEPNLLPLPSLPTH